MKEETKKITSLWKVALLSSSTCTLITFGLALIGDISHWLILLPTIFIAALVSTLLAVVFLNKDYLTPEKENLAPPDEDMATELLKNISIMKNLKIGISVVKNRQFFWVNKHFAQIFNKTPEEMKGKSTQMIYGSPGDFEEIGKQAYEKLKEEGCAVKEIEFKKQNGEIFHGKLTGSLLSNEYSIWVAEDKTKQKDFERALTSAKEKAEAATRLKSDSMANMSHEIRTPMNGIISMINLMAHTPLTQEQAGYLETMQLSGENLMRIINDIIDFSRLESGKLKLTQKTFKIRKCVESVIDLLYSKAARKKIELIYFVESKIPEFVTGDITRLSQVLLNLADNAVKYTKKGEVYLRASIEDGGSINFSVTDTGSGIPQHLIPHLFDRFTRLEAHSEEEGAGLGLAITEKLVELMGSMIKVESKENKGSTFSFSIKFSNMEIGKEPDQREVLKGKKILLAFKNELQRKILFELCSDLQMSPKMTASEEETISVNLEDFDFIFIEKDFSENTGIKLGRRIKEMLRNGAPKLILASSSISPEIREKEKGEIFELVIQKPVKNSRLPENLEKILENAAQKKQEKENRSIEPTLKPARKLNILIADDQPINIKIANTILNKFGQSADAAQNGLETLKAVEEKNYDIILLDCIMPELDGYETAKIINKMYSPEQRPKIIALTGNVFSETKDKIINAGMDGFLSKPVTINDIENILEKFNSETKNKNFPKKIDKELPHETNTLALDLEFLKKHLNMGADLLNELFNIFIEETPEKVEDLKKALKEGNASVARDISHGLKGAASTIGAIKFSRLCREIQKISETGKIVEEKTIVDLQSAFEETQDAIKNNRNITANANKL